MSGRLLVQGGEVVDQTGRRRADVAIEDGRVVQVAPGIDAPPDAVVLDASGCVVCPGLVDLQVHLREPGAGHWDSIASGAQAAAQGGVTAMVAMPNTVPCIDTPELVRWVRAEAERHGSCDVMAAAAISVGRRGDTPTDVVALWEAGARLFTDDGTAVMDSQLLRVVMQAAAELPGAYVGQHAEDEALVAGGHLHEGAVSAALGLRGRPAEAEEIVVARDLTLARLTGCRYHVLHASCAATLALVDGARRQGASVTVEVTPQHLTFTDDALAGGDTLFKMNPPLRAATDRDALRSALVGGRIDAVATDHAPHPDDRKARPLAEAPPGMTGLETAFAAVHTELVLSGRWSIEAAIAAMSWIPARIAGLDHWGHGSPVAPGSPANLAVIDPAERWIVDPSRLASRSANNPFRGRELVGRVRHTILRGEPTLRGSELRTGV